MSRTVQVMHTAGASIALTALLAGCAASQSQPRLAVAPPAASQPAGESTAFDVQQLSGQIVAGVQAELSSTIETAVETTLRAEVQATGIGGNATGYNSEFGVGATLVVSLALLLALILSHRREVLRIKQNGKADCSAVRLLDCSGRSRSVRSPNSPTVKQSNSLAP